MSEQDHCIFCLHEAHWGVCGKYGCKCEGKITLNQYLHGNNDLLLTEVPKPLLKLRAQFVEHYKFLSDERVQLAQSKQNNGWSVFGPDEEDERREREVEEQDTKLWAKMEAYRDAIALIDGELSSLVKEHLVAVPMFSTSQAK